MLRIGLSGGMGAGKSTVARALVERGAVLIDGDAIAREVVAPGTPGLAALVSAFGTGILAEDGSLNRPALAAVAFADDEARATLNGITHPLVGQRTSELIAAAPADAIVVQDIPLLVENRLGALMHLVVIVEAELRTRIQRLQEFRGITPADAMARIDVQATDAQRRAAADVLLDNNAGAADLVPQVATLWDERLVPFERNLRTRKGAARGAVCLVAPDPGWPDAAERLRARLAVVCGAAARHIDHIGSTAVPGLVAKDVIDLQMTVADWAAADGLADALAGAGFPRLDEFRTDDPKAGTDPATWEKRLHVNADPGRPVNLHVRVEGSPGERFALDFRDWLRMDPAAREEYSAVKRKAEAAAADLTGRAAIEEYLAVKGPWFDEVYPRVRAWADTR